MMKHYGSKLLALLLCMMTVIGMMPMTASADSGAAAAGQLTVVNAGFEEASAEGVPGWMSQRGTLKPKGLFERTTA